MPANIASYSDMPFALEFFVNSGKGKVLKTVELEDGVKAYLVTDNKGQKNIVFGTGRSMFDGQLVDGKGQN